MRKNTVIMDLDDYTKMVMDRRMMEEELRELKEDLIPSYVNECIKLDEKNHALKKEIIKFAVDTFNIEYYELRDITDVKDIRFAISEENRDILYMLGITEREMIQVIKELKEEFEAKKDGEE